MAHRLVYALQHHVRRPRGVHVLHHCDNRPCVNWRHMFVGDGKDNLRDMAHKGRAGGQKLGVEAVGRMLGEYATGNVSQYQLAAKYNVHQTLISQLVRGKEWRRPAGEGG